MLNKVIKKVIHMEKTKQVQQLTLSLLEKYEATMVLAAVGDAMGYMNGHWQFTHSGSRIHQQMMKMTHNKGISELRIEPSRFRYSDDTVMHFATAEALINSLPNQDQSSICHKFAYEYQKCWQDMGGRAPGNTCRKGIFRLDKNCSNWNSNPFSSNAGGCGGAMRSACIGLFYPHTNDIQRLISISIESGRITHHNPIGYLGSMIASYFTALAIRSVHPNEWLSLLMTQAFPLSQKYITQSKISVVQNLNGGDWQKCVKKWKRYANSRKMDLNKPSQPYFPSEYGVEDREKFYLQVSNGAWPGGLGIDSVIIAYDGLLGCNGNWDELCLRAMLHGGDNDSTGTIAGAWFGALYGYNGVSKLNMNEVEGKEKAINYGQKLFNIVFKQQKKLTKSTQ